MGQISHNSGDAHCSTCRFENLKALYRLNTAAKEYADSADASYNNGLKERARIHSQRKKALYGLKQSILEQLLNNGCVDEIRTHEIDGRNYYCLYVGEFSFHTPTSEWDTPPEDAPESSVELETFTADPDDRPTDMSERDALHHLSDVFDSPNYHLNAPFTDGNYGATFVGWSYLPGALEEGDRVPDRHLHDHNDDRNFIFDVGDRFQTGNGVCEIQDRYHAYQTPLWDRSPLLQRGVYDVALDGDCKECVREQRIVDEWHILANSIADPIPNVDGTLADTVRRDIERHEEDITFEIGDILELQPRLDNGTTIFCRLTEVHVSGGILIGQYEPVPPSDDAPLGLTIQEIANDVVAVHREPPMKSE